MLKKWRNRASVAVLVVAFVASAAAAQTAAGEVEQIGGDRAPETNVGQIVQAPRTADALPVGEPAEDVPATSESSPQLSASGNSRERTNQLNREGRAGPAPVQLYRGGRTALPSEPLSRPSEGRTSAVAAVTGEDRCDPASREGESRRPVCAQVIETRSAEFRRLEPVRSAEEALMIDQRQREQAASAEAAARRLADNSGDPDSFDEQSIAAVVLIDSRNFPEAREELPAEGSTSLAEAIAAAVTGTPPPR